MACVRVLAVAGGALGVIAGARGQATVTVDCSGASISTTGTPADIVRTSAGTISAATGYQFAFNPRVTGTGAFGGAIIGTNQPLMTVRNGLSIGSQRTLMGALRNPGGTIPTRLDFEVVNQTVSGQQISLTFDQQILADGRAQAAIRNISRPCCFIIGMDVVSGGLVASTFVPPPPVISEWHFDGNLLSVRESEQPGAGGSGAGKLRYLDDPMFGPVLGGVGSETTYPSSPPTPGLTDEQSSFGTTTSFGIPAIGAGGGAPDTVYKTSPPRSTAAPTDASRFRQVGLVLWPNTRDTWPDERIGQWTLVADLLIPQASWDAARAGANNQCIPLMEASQNNNSSADAFVTVSGAAPGVARVGINVAPASALAASAIQPNVWFRLAIVNDLYGKAASRIFVNGALVGTSGADWVYNACMSSSPRWGNNSAQPAAGSAVPPASNATTVPPATFTGWGGFPSPWAYSGGYSPGAAASGAPMASTFGLFCDINGRGESVYIANLMFTDEAIGDAAVAALGGPNARGIVYLRPLPCAPDFDGNGTLHTDDLFAFINAWFAADVRADYNASGGLGVDDIFAFINGWFAGC